MNVFFSKNKNILLVILLLVFSFLLIFPGLELTDLWDRDETWYAEIAREMLESDNLLVPRYNDVPFYGKPVLAYWMVVLSYRIFGVSEFSARFFSVVFGIGTVILTFFLGKLLFDLKTGCLSALILCTSLLFVVISRAVVVDAFLVFFITGTFLFFFKFVYSKKKKVLYVILAFIFAALATLTKGPMGILFPVVIVVFYFIITRQSKALLDTKLLWGILVFLIIAVPWYILVNKATGGGFGRGFLVRDNLTRFFRPIYSHMAGFSGAVWFYIPVLLVGFIPWVVFLPQAVWAQVKRRENHFYFLCIWIGVIFVFFSVAATKFPHYILPVFPAVAIITGRFWSEFMFGVEEFRKREWVSMGITLLVLIFIDITVLLFLGLGFRIYPELISLIVLFNFLILLIGNGASMMPIMGARKVKAGFYSIVLTMLVFFLMLNVFTVPELGAKRIGFKSLSAVVASQAGSDDNILAYGFIEPSIVFYTRRFVTKVDSLDELNEYLDSEAKVFVFIEELPFHKVREKLKGNVYILCKRKGFSEVRSKFMSFLVISNREE